MLRLGGLGEPGLSAKIDAGFLVSTVPQMVLPVLTCWTDCLHLLLRLLQDDAQTFAQQALLESSCLQ